VIGVPSMRMLKEIPVFTPNAWQGYGYGSDQGDTVLREGSDPAKSEPLGWGDTHHPAISETDGMYDGRFLYINDRANGRIAMVDLRDFKTKQILDIPNLQTSHGGCFVTPSTEYVHISSMTPSPVTESGYAPLSRYKEDFRGFSTWLRIDQDTGRFVLDESFQIELPPYTQDLADAGKLASFGFGFINTYNTEMATGGNLHGGHPDPAASLEAAATLNDYDLLNIIDWQKAEEFVKAGSGVKTLNGMRVVPLEAAAREGILHFAPEPRNPHGVDVSPTGDYIVVSGKLDPNGNVYSAERIKQAIADQDYDGTDPFGVPILKLDSVLEAQVELGAGPLHSQFDDQGHAYTSLFVDTAIAKWTLGPKAGHDADAFQLVEKLPVQYNIGHLHGRGRHRAAGREVHGRAEQVVDRPVPAGRHAAPAELPAGRPDDARADGARRHAERHGRAPQRADDPSGQAGERDPGLRARHRSAHLEAVAVRGRRRRGARGAAGQRPPRVHVRPAIALHPRRDRGEGRRHAAAAPHERRADPRRDARVRDPRPQHRGIDRPRRGREHRPAVDTGRHVRHVLLGVLLGAAPRDAGLAPGDPVSRQNVAR
jgi:hypothetical protein